MLEIGCGRGEVLAALAPHVERVVGTELSQVRAQRVRRDLAHLPNWRILTGTSEDLAETAAPPFDCIVWADVIEHVVDVLAVFRDIARLAKPGGFLVTVTPNVASLKRRLALARGRFPSTSGSDEGFGMPEGEMFDGGHVHYFTFRSVERLHREHGFDADVARLGFGRFGRLHDLWPTLLSGGVAARSRRE